LIDGEKPAKSIWASFEWDGKPLIECPVSLISSESYHYLQAMDYVESGFLPEGGGLNDQFEYDLIMIGIASGEKAACQTMQQSS